MALGLAMLMGPADARDLAAALAVRQTQPDATRLACYDRLTAHENVVEFTGSGSRITSAFAVTKPARMTFASSDAVMVVYLLDDRGKVVQNFHQTRVCQGTFLLRHGVWQNAGRAMMPSEKGGVWLTRSKRRRALRMR